MRLLVCGGRDYGETEGDVASVFDTLDHLHGAEPVTLLIEGGAMGADHLARTWAALHCVNWTYAAEWDRHGRAAGPIRNQRMLDEGKPDLVVAFPGGRGTADMVRRARAAGVKVIEVAR